jgi:hypothetical protein
MNRSRRRIALLVFLSLLYLLVGFNYGLPTYDEGISVYGAARILNGDVVYRDFWTLYGPAQFYVLADLYKLFGTSLIVGRIYHVIASCLLVFAVTAIAMRFCSWYATVIAWCFALIWIGDFRFPTSPLVPALVFAMLGTLFLIRFIQDTRNRDLILAGIAVGLATLFRPDIGAYLLVSEYLVLLAFGAYQPAPRPRKARWACVARVLGYYSIGVIAVIVPVTIYLIYVASARELANDLILFPFTVFPKVRGLPWPSPIPSPADFIGGHVHLAAYVKSLLVRVPFYFPLVVYAAVVGVTIAGRRAGREGRTLPRAEDDSGNTVWVVMLLASAGVIFIGQAVVRSQVSHLLPTMLPAGVLAAWLVQRVHASRWTRRTRSTLVVVMYLFLSASLLLPLRNEAHVVGLLAPHASSYKIDLPRARGIRLDKNEHSYQEALQFVREHVPPGERIFVGNVRHDMIFTNDILFYFLADRHSATKYHELHPGLVTTRSVQDEIIADLKRYDVRCVVLRDRDVIEPNASAESSGVVLLDRYIRERFAPVQQFGEYEVWLLRRGDEDKN